MFSQRLLNLTSTLRTVLTAYLQALAAGQTMVQFLESNEVVRDLIQEVTAEVNSIVRLTQQMETFRQRNQELIGESLTLRREYDELLARPSVSRDPLVLLETALDILRQRPVTVMAFEPAREEVQSNTPQQDPSILHEDESEDESESDDEFELEDLFEDTEDSFEEEEEEEEYEEPSTPVSPAPSTPRSSDETHIIESESHFNLDDELEQSTQTPVLSDEFAKNPEIRENLDGLENDHMIRFVFVRYSHLPYHYTVSGTRYKFILNGSQVISTIV